MAGQKHFHWLPATFNSSVSATQLVHKRFDDLRVPQPRLRVSNSKHVKSFCPTRSSVTAVRHLGFTVVHVVRMCYHALSQWTCVRHIWLKIIPLDGAIVSILSPKADSPILASLWKMIFARGLTISVFGK